MNAKRLILLSLAVLCAAVGPAQDYTLTRGLPGIVFAYGAELPIADQSRVATVVWPDLSERGYMGEYTLTAVDGVPLTARARNSPFRRHEATPLAVDLLPGRHILTFSYSEYLPSGRGRQTYNVATPTPVAVAAELEAGMVYQLRAVLLGGTFERFSLDAELSDADIVERLAASRAAGRMAYTPLAGGAVPDGGRADLADTGSATVSGAPENRRHTVAPAAPKGGGTVAVPVAPPPSTVALTTAPPPTAESTAATAPATAAVGSAKRRRTVAPAEPKRGASTTAPVAAPAAPHTVAAATAPATVPAPNATFPAPPDVAATTPSAASTTGTALIHIYRVGRMAGAAVGYDVRLGEQTLYRARNNSGATIPVSGTGTVALWARTEQRVDLPIAVEPGREYWVRCGMRMGAFVGRPTLEAVDAATGRAEMAKIPADRLEAPHSAQIALAPAPATVPEADPAAAAELAAAATAVEETVEEPVSAPPVTPVTPVTPAVPTTPESAPKPEIEPAIAGNGTIDIIRVAMPDSVVFRPAAGVEFPVRELAVHVVSGSSKFAFNSLNIKGLTFKIGNQALSLDVGNGTVNSKSRIRSYSEKERLPDDGRPRRIVFTVSGREMIYDVERALWVDAAGKPVAGQTSAPEPVTPPAPTLPTDATPPSTPVPALLSGPEAITSGWDGENFIATFDLDFEGYAKGRWSIEVRPPFPHPITGLDDPHVQTVIGLELSRMSAGSGMKWLERATRQDNVDAMMMLALSYTHDNPGMRNLAEAERWLRRAVELDNAEAQAKLDDLLAGRPVNGSFKTSHTYNFGFRYLP